MPFSSEFIKTTLVPRVYACVPRKRIRRIRIASARIGEDKRFDKKKTNRHASGKHTIQEISHTLHVNTTSTQPAHTHTHTHTRSHPAHPSLHYIVQPNIEATKQPNTTPTTTKEKVSFCFQYFLPHIKRKKKRIS